MEPRIRINPQINTVQDCFTVFNKKPTKSIRNRGNDFDSLNTSYSRGKPYFYHPYHSSEQSNSSRNYQRDKLLHFNHEELDYYYSHNYQPQQQQQSQELPIQILPHSEEQLLQQPQRQQPQQDNVLRFHNFEYGKIPKAQAIKHQFSNLTNGATQIKHCHLPINSASPLSLSATELTTGSLQSMPSTLNEATMEPQSPSTDSDNNKMYNKGDWTEEEHRRFLKGYEECGCQWKLIAENYVKTRDRRQTSSHAQNFLKKIKQQQHH